MEEKMEKVAEAFTEYFVPCFVKECKVQGIEFKNNEELEAGLETALLIQQAAPAIQKHAAATEAKVSPIVQANELLKQAMFPSQDTEREAALGKLQAAIQPAE